MDKYRKNIAESIFNAIGYNGKIIELENIIEIPKNNENGDYSFPAFKLTKQLKKDPKEIAGILSKADFSRQFFEKIETIGPFLNFFVNKKAFMQETLDSINAMKERFGLNESGKGKKVMVEFSSPNTNKPMHIGHIRNNSIGDAISNIYSANGFDVIKANLINNRGVHICKSMFAYQEWGEGKTPESENKKSDHFVGDFYVLFAQKAKDDKNLEKVVQLMLQKWEKGDKEIIELWKKMNLWAFKGFDETYKNYCIEFDKHYYESELYDKGRNIILSGLKKKTFEKDDGAIVAKLERFGLPDKVLIRSDGTTIYMTQDVYLAVKKFEDFDLAESIHVVGSEQNLHFKQLFKIIELLGFDWAKNLCHLSYGMIYLPDGKIKSREGNVVDADDLLQEVESLALEQISKRHKLDEEEKRKRARKIALGAIKFMMLKIDSVKDIYFNPKESISFEGETGPYVMYSYARCKSILKKEPFSGKTDYSVLENEKEFELIKLLSAYPNVVSDSLRIKSMHRLSHYLIDLGQKFNEFYQIAPILNSEQNLKQARLGLVKATSIVLQNGLKLLGINTLEAM